MDLLNTRLPGSVLRMGVWRVMASSVTERQRMFTPQGDGGKIGKGGVGSASRRGVVLPPSRSSRRSSCEGSQGSGSGRGAASLLR